MSAIVHSAGTGRASTGLVAAMRWSVLARAGEKAGARSIRHKASQTGASRYAVSHADAAIYLGLYHDPVNGARETPKALHSLALVFLAGLMADGVDRNSINAALLMEPDGRPNDRAVVIIEGGAIVRDSLDEKTKAVSAVRDARQQLPSLGVFAEQDDFPGRTAVTWEQLQSGVSTATAIRSVPPNTIVLLVLALVAVVAAGAFAYNEMVLKPEEARKRALQAAAADQTASYLASLRAALSNTGWKAGDIQASTSRIDAEPFYFSGWVLEERACTVRTCVSRWKRQGGELPALSRLLSSAAYDVDRSNLDTSYFTQDAKGTPAQLTVEQLPSLANAATGLRPILQRFANAGIVVGSAGPERWPAADFSQVKASAIATRTPLELSGIPLPIAGKVIAELPPYAVLEGYTLSVSPGELGGMFKVKLKGFVYAK
jgi:hypothetical protein